MHVKTNEKWWGVFVSRSFSEPWPKTLGELQGQQNVVLQKPSSTYQVFRANSTFCVDQACTFRCVPTGSYYHEIEMVFHLHFKSGASSSCSRQKCQPCLVKIHIFTLCNFCQRRPKKRGMIFASVLGTRLKDRLITLEFSLKYFRDAGRGQGGVHGWSHVTLSNKALKHVSCHFTSCSCKHWSDYLSVITSSTMDWSVLSRRRPSGPPFKMEELHLTGPSSSRSYNNRPERTCRPRPTASFFHQPAIVPTL